MPNRQEQLALILLKYWDPLQVVDIDIAPEQEYLAEAGELSDLVDSGAGREAIAERLSKRGRELGLVDTQRNERASQAVWEWFNTP